MIEIKGVTKKYGKFTAIDKISLTVEDSSVLGLAGFNGCGKTTLLNVCAGIVKANEGAVLLDGADSFGNDTTRRNMFYVSDVLWSPAGATIKSLAKYYSSYFSDFDYELLKSLCELFSLDDKKPVKSFSKGMLRQAYLSLALASRPKFLLIDESFDGLDPEKKDIIKKLLLQYINETEASVIISSHNLNEIAEVCDRIAIIKGSKIILESSIDDISGSFRKVIVTFSDEITEDFIKDVSHTSFKVTGKQAQIVVTGDISAQIEKLKALGGTVTDEQYLTLEEVFNEETEANANEEKIRRIFKK